MSLFRRIFPIFLANVFLLCACSSTKPVATPQDRIVPISTNQRRELADLARFPQNVAVFAARAGKTAPLISPQKQTEEAKRLESAFFRPWTMEKSGLSPKTFAMAMTGYDQTTFYGRNLLPIPEHERKDLTARTGMTAFPSMAKHGIATRETSMRALPTSTPFYHAPWKAGEGYPFDMLQHGIIRQGMPLFISHTSTDGAWLFCETAWGAGWLPTDAVATTDAAFEEAWKALPLAVITRERAQLFLSETTQAPVSDRKNAPSFSQSAALLHIGTLLPYRPSDSNSERVLLLPARDELGNARLMNSVTARENAAPFPLPFTAATLALLADQLMGLPYEWGGAYGGRDCSLLTRELMQSVGIFLPVNSARQLTAGDPRQLDGMTPDAKLDFIKNNAVPFRTLVGFPGHVALYLGEWDNEPAILHCIWGLRTKDGGYEGRLLIGKVAITSLNPGMEWDDVRAGAPLLPRLKTMTLLPRL